MRAGDAFPVNRQNKSTEPVEVAMRVVPVPDEVKLAELGLFQDGNLVRTITLPRFEGGVASHTFPTGSTFVVDSLYEARLVINRATPEERVSVNGRLRPSRIDIVADGGTIQEVELVPGEDLVDVLRTFNGAPAVTIRVTGLRNSYGLPVSTGEQVTVKAAGTVTSAVAPIEKVVLNEIVVPVASTGSGSEGLGPFTGSYVGEVKVGPQAELVTAYAVDAALHVSTHSVGIYPQPRTAGLIPGRDVVEFDPLESGTTDGRPYGFRVVLKDRGSRASRSTLGFAGRALVLQREADATYRSSPLLVVPGNVNLPGTTPRAVADARLALEPGRAEVRYGRVRTRPIVSGLVVRLPAGGVAVSVGSAGGQPHAIELAQPGSSGETLEVLLTSLTGRMEPLEPASSQAGGGAVEADEFIVWASSTGESPSERCKVHRSCRWRTGPQCDRSCPVKWWSWGGCGGGNAQLPDSVLAHCSQ